MKDRYIWKGTYITFWQPMFHMPYQEAYRLFNDEIQKEPDVMSALIKARELLIEMFPKINYRETFKKTHGTFSYL